MKNILSTSLLALAGLAFSMPSAKALSYTDGDLLVAFRGTTSTYLLNLGSSAEFQTGGLFATGNKINVSGSIASDLSAVNATSWSIQGSDPFVTGSVWASKQENTPGIASSPYPNDSQSALDVPGFSIMAVGAEFANGTAASNANGFIQLNTNTNSYRSYQPGGANNSFNINYDYFQPGFEGTFASTSGSTLDLYRIDAASGNATRLGAFQVDGSGLWFSSDVSDFGSPVPEPATLAFGFAVLGACAMGRFRTRQQAELAA